jgi:predicted transcriptional regulator
MTNAEQFLSHHVAIEKYLRRTYGSVSQHETFFQLITKAEKKNAVIQYYSDDLREYGELRNAIVHNRSPESNTVIAEPHSFVVDRISHIRSMIEHPKKVSAVMTAPVFTASVADLLYPTAQKMIRQLYTHVPVYNNTGDFVGVLSETAILRWVGNRVKQNKQLEENRTIAEIIDWLDKTGNKHNDYEFMPKNTAVLDVKKRFEHALEQGRRLGAIFITKTGKSTEKIEGVITAWDFPRLTLD